MLARWESSSNPRLACTSQSKLLDTANGAFALRLSQKEQRGKALVQGRMCGSHMLLVSLTMKGCKFISALNTVDGAGHSISLPALVMLHRSGSFRSACALSKLECKNRSVDFRKKAALQRHSQEIRSEQTSLSQPDVTAMLLLCGR